MSAALAALASSNVQIFQAFLGRRAVVVGWEDSPEGQRSIEALRSLWGITGEDNGIYIGERWESRSISEVVEWAIERCEMRDASEVGAQLAEFRKNAVVERLHYALIPELWMETHEPSFTFSDGTVLAKIGLHPDRKLVEELARIDFSSLPRLRTDLYLGFSVVEPCHFGQRPKTNNRDDSQRLLDIAMCINLSRPVDGAISLSAMSNFYSGDTPLVLRGHSWSIPYHRQPSTQNGLIEILLRNADQLYERLRLCDETLKDRVRVAARFLSHFGMADDIVDQLISLRVALEAFFCYPPGSRVSEVCEVCGARANENGPTALVRTRAALLLGHTMEERCELRRLFGDVYGMLSRAAHSGRIGSKYDREKVHRVAEFLRQSIRKLIENGLEFDWVGFE